MVTFDVIKRGPNDCNGVEGSEVAGEVEEDDAGDGTTVEDTEDAVIPFDFIPVRETAVDASE